MSETHRYAPLLVNSYWGPCGVYLEDGTRCNKVYSEPVHQVPRPETSVASYIANTAAPTEITGPVPGCGSYRDWYGVPDFRQIPGQDSLPFDEGTE